MLTNTMEYVLDNIRLNTLASQYKAVVVMKADYYPFGMTMEERYDAVTDYRYAYNGMEVDPEMKGNGNSYTTEFRQYDPRLGRWLSLDPLMAMFPHSSPYVSYDNNPVFYTDRYGLTSTSKDVQKEIDHAVLKLKNLRNTWKKRTRILSSYLILDSAKYASVLVRTKSHSF